MTTRRAFITLLGGAAEPPVAIECRRQGPSACPLATFFVSR